MTTAPSADDPRRRVDAAIAASGRTPLAVLDVDLTLLDNAERTRAIWVDWLHRVRDQWDGAEAAAERAQVMPVTFGVLENLETLGVPAGDLTQAGLRFWLEHFFDGHYCRRDTPMPGAVDAVRRLVSRGVTVVYLTARPAQMVEGTVARFAELGLPVGVPGTLLAMKPDRAQPDQAYKEDALRWIGGLGHTVLCADNEPGHVNAMLAAFPEAVCGHVATRHSAGGPPLDPRAVQVPRLADLVP